MPPADILRHAADAAPHPEGVRALRALRARRASGLGVDSPLPASTHPPTIELLGWAYDAGYRTRVLGNESLILMARSDGHEVIVLMDKLASDRPLPAPTAPGVHLHRRVVGQMVVYEVSRSATPLVADKVYDPEAKKQTRDSRRQTSGVSQSCGRARAFGLKSEVRRLASIHAASAQTATS